MKEGEFRYSGKIPGNARNHRFAQRFDINYDGYLGIQQFDGAKVADRVLLSPAQVKALLAFLKKKS
jgi:hypothetical protein